MHCDSLQFFLILNTYDMVSDTCISFFNGIKHLAQKVWHIPLVHCIFFNDHLTNLISSNHSIHIKKILNHISWYKLSKSMVFHHQMTKFNWAKVFETISSIYISKIWLISTCKIISCVHKYHENVMMCNNVSYFILI